MIKKLILSTLLLCGLANAAPSSTLDAVLERGVLRVGFDAGYQPFEMTNKQGQYIGFDVDLAKMVAKEMGVKVEFVNTAWDGIIPALLTDKFDVIMGGIRDALADAGFEHVDTHMTLSPPWTTDWIAPEGKRKLAAFGIAPPGRAASRIDVTGISPLRRATDVACPRCGSTRTALLAQFGSTACKALYRCGECREPFDYFKPY